MRPFLLVLLCCALANAQSFERNRITFSGGITKNVGSFSSFGDTAVGLGGTYGFRLLKPVELETGVFTALQPREQACGSSGCYDPNDRFLWVPFGVRFIAPLPGRIELSVGGGGLYEKYSVSNPNRAVGSQSYSGWGGYASGGVAFAVDKNKHFWIGGSPRVFLANPSFFRDRWFMFTGDISFRF